MQTSDFFRLIETAAECAPGKVSAGMPLADVPGWDSLAVVGFIAALDKQLGIRVPAAALAECKTVSDLIALTDGRVTP